MNVFTELYISLCSQVWIKIFWKVWTLFILMYMNLAFTLPRSKPTQVFIYWHHPVLQKAEKKINLFMHRIFSLCLKWVGPLDLGDLRLFLPWPPTLIRACSLYSLHSFNSRTTLWLYTHAVTETLFRKCR